MTRILLVLFLFLGVACGDEEDQAADEQVTGIVGSWQGVQKLIDPEKNAEITREVELIIHSDGRFELFEAEGARSAMGVYEHFSRLQALTFRFRESTMTDFALAGSIFNFEYDLQGQELLLRSQRVVFWLKRKGVQPEPVDQLNGKWACRESSSEQHWQLTIAGSDFSMLRRRSGQAALLLRGQIEWPTGMDLESEASILGRWVVLEAQPVRVFEGFDVRVDFTTSGDDRQILLSLFPWQDSGGDSQVPDYYLLCQQ